MPRNQIIGRVEKLEQSRPAKSYSGVARFIWRGPEDDAALAELERAAEASGRLLIVRTIVDPRKENPQAIIKNGVVIRDDCGKPLG